MIDNFSWTCPYCNRAVTITNQNYSDDVHFFDEDNKDGKLGLKTTVITCPNKDCREYTITGALYQAYWDHANKIQSEILVAWTLKPRSMARQFPSYVPTAIIADYEEACLIRDLSPKASATLSRRCLQGIIRDFWDIKKNRLVDEIKALQEKVDPIIWEAIDSVRSIGNIGAHMEKDINLIIDVEPKEAQLLIGLIEFLIKDWYISRHDRQVHLKNIVGVAEQKADDKKSNKGIDRTR